MRRIGRSGKQCDESLPAGLRQPEIGSPGTLNNSIEGADQQGVYPGLVLGLDLFEHPVEFGDINIAQQGIAPQAGIALRHDAMARDLFRRVNSLLDRYQHGDDETGNARHIGTNGKPAAKCGAARHPNHHTHSRPEPTEQPSMKLMRDGVTLGIEPGFVDRARVGGGLAVFHGETPMFAEQAAAVAAFAPAAAPGCADLQKEIDLLLSWRGLVDVDVSVFGRQLIVARNRRPICSTATHRNA